MAEAKERQIPARMTSGDIFFIETSMGRISLFYQNAAKKFPASEKIPLLIGVFFSRQADLGEKAKALTLRNEEMIIGANIGI
jgi:hypothetical protein